MIVWAIANQKGGVAKTTTAVSLAGHLSLLGKRVLLVDLDPHGSLTTYFQYDPDEIEPSIYHLFQNDTPFHPVQVIRKTKFPNIHVLPASTAMATLDKQLGSQDGKGLVIKNVLLELDQEYDYALIDCPPILGILMVNALAACNHLLLPVQTEFLAIKGLERMLRTLHMIIKARRKEINYTILPVMFDRRTRASIDSLRKLREAYQENIWRQVIPIDTKFRSASEMGVPLPVMLPASRGSQAYAALLADLLGEVSSSTEAAVIT